MKVLIFGLGIHGGGLERARYFLNHNDTVRITDSRTRDEIGGGLDYLESIGAQVSVGELKPEDFQWADIVVKSQSVKLETEILKNASFVTNDFACFFKSPLLNNVKIIIITGSNKTSIASMVCHSLKKLNKSARRCGSMGTSPLTELSLMENGDMPEYIIVEMTLWQLRDTSYFLNGEFPEVELAVINADSNERREFDIFFNNPTVNKIICNKSLIKECNSYVSPLRMKSVHDIFSLIPKKTKNLIDGMDFAFATIRLLGFDSDSITKAFLSYQGIPGRGELVLRTEKIMYYNDSSASIPEAVGFSVQNFENLPVHVICGGGDSLMDAKPMVESLSKCASVHLLSGIFSEKCLIPYLKKKRIKFFGPFDDMNEALVSAEGSTDKVSDKMEVIIYSPGCINFSQMAGNSDWETMFEFAVNLR